MFSNAKLKTRKWFVFEKKSSPPSPLKSRMNKTADNFTRNLPSIPPGPSRPLPPTSLPSEIVINLKRLFCLQNKQINSNQFLELYENANSCTLNYQELGFDSLHDFLRFLEPKMITIHTVPPNLILTPQKSLIEEIMKPLRETKQKNFITIPEQELPKDYRIGDLILVEVAEVFNPRKFWIQLKGRETTEKLEQLMDDMGEHYDKKQLKYRMNTQDIVEGQYCACIFEQNDEWHRAVITKVKDDFHVDVSFFFEFPNKLNPPTKTHPV